MYTHDYTDEYPQEHGQDNAMLARSFYEAYNNRDFDRVTSCIAEGAEWTNVATGQSFRGPDGYRQYLQSWATAFPDSTCEVTNLFSGGDWVLVEFTGRGTHSGPMHGPMGEIPPTGRHVESKFCDVYQFRDGKVVSGRTYFDAASLLGQLGLMQGPQAA
jgi:steroid delta-isomerase-like uncharacterized protein